MFKVLAAMFALGGFLLGAFVSLPLAIVLTIALLLFFGGLAGLGIAVGHASPSLAAALVKFWTVFMLVLASIIGVGAAIGDNLVKAPEKDTVSSLSDAQPSSPAPNNNSDAARSIAFALAAIVIAALAEAGSKLVEDHRAPWLARKAWCSRYGQTIPEMPPAAGARMDAYLALRNGCYDRKPDEGWDLETSETILKAIAGASGA